MIYIPQANRTFPTIIAGTYPACAICLLALLFTPWKILAIVYGTQLSIAAFVVGITLGKIYLETGSISKTIVLHSIFNGSFLIASNLV